MKLNDLKKRAEELAIKGDFFSQEVLEVNQKILEFGKDSGAITRLGRFYFENKDYEQALKLFKKIDRDDTELHRTIARNRIEEINRIIQIQKGIRNLNSYEEAVDLYMKFKNDLKENEKEEILKKIRESITNESSCEKLFDIYEKFKSDLRKEITKDIIEKFEKSATSEKEMILLAYIYKSDGDEEKYKKITSPIYEESESIKSIALIRKIISPIISEKMCKRILKKTPEDVMVKNCLCASLADQGKGLEYLKECIKKHGIDNFNLVVFHFLQIDFFFFQTSFLDYIASVKKDILKNYLDTLRRHNVRNDKQDAILKVLMN